MKFWSQMTNLNRLVLILALLSIKLKQLLSFWDTLLASYGKMGAKDGNRAFCSIVPNSLGSRAVDGWSHKVCKQGDCGHVTPLSWRKPQHGPCSNKRAVTPGRQGCFSSLALWQQRRNYYKGAGRTEELLQRSWALLSRIFF